MGWTRETVKKVALRTGYPVVEAWSSHSAGAMGTVYGPMLHHTGTPDSAAGDYPTLKVVRDGRAGLENSLSMYGLGRSGTIYCISEKVSWHAGAGDWNGVTNGNAHFAGIEAESGGAGKWYPAQLDSYQKLVASILMETGRGTDWMPTHAQWANPPGRKTDPAGINMTDFKNKVQGYLNNKSLTGGFELNAEDKAYLDARFTDLLNNVRGYGNRVENIERHLAGTGAIDYRGHHGNAEDNTVGQVLSIRQAVQAIRTHLGI